MNTSVRNHLVWGVLGATLTAGMWWAWSIPGAAVMFAAIGMAFVLWYRMSSQGAWVALAVMGVAMSSILGWQAATGARCPAGGTKVFLKVDKPPVGCDEIRASAGSMSAFFGIIAMLAIGTPIYVRRLEAADDFDDIEPVSGA